MPTITLPLDLTGVSPVNQVLNEVHAFSVAEDRIFVLQAGPFYSEGLEIRALPSNALLQPGTQYKLLWLNKDAVMASGKEVCAVVYVTDPTIGEVTVSYQAVGGDYTTTIDAIQQVLDALSLPDANEVTWGQIVGTPAQFDPVDHLHHSRDIFGMEELTAQLEALRAAITAGDGGTLNALYQYISSKVQEAIDLAQNNVTAAGVLAAIDTHKQDVNAHTKANVGLGSVQNFPPATQTQALAGTPNTYLTSDRAADAVAGALRSIGVDFQDPNTTVKPLCLARGINCPTGNDGFLNGDTFLVITFFNVAAGTALNNTAANRYQIAFAMFNNIGQISGIYKRVFTSPAWTQWTDNGGMKYLTNQNLNNLIEPGEYLQLNVPDSSPAYALANFQTWNYPVAVIASTLYWAWIGRISVVKYAGEDIIQQTLYSGKFAFGATNLETDSITFTRYRINGVWDSDWSSSRVLKSPDIREDVAGLSQTHQVTPFDASMHFSAHAAIQNANMKLDTQPNNNTRITSLDSNWSILSGLVRSVYSNDYDNVTATPSLLMYKSFERGTWLTKKGWTFFQLRPNTISGGTQNGLCDLVSIKPLGRSRFRSTLGGTPLNQYAQWLMTFMSRSAAVATPNSYLGKLTLDTDANTAYTPGNVSYTHQACLRFQNGVSLFNIAVDKKTKLAMLIMTEYNSTTNVRNTGAQTHVMFSRDSGFNNAEYGLPKAISGPAYTNVYYRNNAILRATEPASTYTSAGVVENNATLNSNAQILNATLGPIANTASSYDGMGICRTKGFHTFHLTLDTSVVIDSGQLNTWPLRRVDEFVVDLTAESYELRWMDLAVIGTTRWVVVGCDDGKVRIFRKQQADATYSLFQTVTLVEGISNEVIRVGFISGAIAAFQRQTASPVSDATGVMGGAFVIGNVYKFTFNPNIVPSDPRAPYVYLADQDIYIDYTYALTGRENSNWMTYADGDFYTVHATSELFNDLEGGGQTYRMDTGVYKGQLVYKPAGWIER